jgi:hypothetical protein
MYVYTVILCMCVCVYSHSMHTCTLTYTYATHLHTLHRNREALRTRSAHVHHSVELVVTDRRGPVVSDGDAVLKSANLVQYFTYSAYDYAMSVGYMSVLVHVCVQRALYVCICMYVCMYGQQPWMYACMCVHIYIWTARMTMT